MKIKLKQKILVTTFAFVCATTPVFAQEAIYAVADGKLNASELTYDFYDDSLYCINVKVGHVTDIILHQGENFISAIGGDTKQWMIDKARVGNVTHIYIKPLVNSARTDIIINTDKRSYHFLVTATDYYNPIVSFNFPEEIAAQKKAEIKKLNEPTKEEKEFMTIFTESKNGEVVLKDMNYKYKIKANNKRLAEDICPKKVFDDGVRTLLMISCSNDAELINVAETTGLQTKAFVGEADFQIVDYAGDKCIQFKNDSVFNAMLWEMNDMSEEERNNIFSGAGFVSQWQLMQEADQEQELIVDNYEKDLSQPWPAHQIKEFKQKYDDVFMFEPYDSTDFIAHYKLKGSTYSSFVNRRGVMRQKRC